MSSDPPASVPPKPFESVAPEAKPGEARPEVSAEATRAAGEAERIVQAFGGIRPMAKIMNLAVTTVQGWKERGAIPVARMPEVREAAQRIGLDLDAVLAGKEVPQPALKPAEPARAEKIMEPPPAGVAAAPAAPAPPILDQAPPPARQAGWFRFGAGVGAAFVAGGLLVWFLGPMRGNGGDRQPIEAMQSRLTGLAGQVEEQSRRVKADADALQARIARIDAAERAIREQSERLASVAASASALAARVEQIDEAVKRLAAGAPADPAETRALREEVRRLAAALDALPKGAGDTAALARLAEDVRQAAQRLAALEQRLEALARAPAPAPEQRAAAERAAAEIDALKKQIAELGAQSAEAARRLAAAEAELRRVTAAGGNEAAVVAAVGQLRQDLARGAPYRASWNAVAALTRERTEFKPPLETLAPLADKGIATPAQLRERFDRLSVAILRAAHAAPDGDWLDRTWARLKSLVVVRRTGEPDGAEPEHLVSQAETALRRGDLARATALVNRLPERTRMPAAAWLAEAQARLDAEAALVALDRAALALVTRGAGEAPKRP